MYISHLNVYKWGPSLCGFTLTLPEGGHPAQSEIAEIYLYIVFWNCMKMKQIGIFLYFLWITTKAQRQAWINGFKEKVELEHPAGLIYPLAHPGCGEDWQPTNHHHVYVFYMIKHMEGTLNHPYLTWQNDSCKTPFAFLCTYWQEVFPFKKLRLIV